MSDDVGHDLAKRAGRVSRMMIYISLVHFSQLVGFWPGGGAGSGETTEQRPLPTRRPGDRPASLPGPPPGTRNRV